MYAFGNCLLLGKVQRIILFIYYYLQPSPHLCTCVSTATSGFITTISYFVVVYQDDISVVFDDLTSVEATT
jgi:hypothetical protein